MGWLLYDRPPVAIAEPPQVHSPEPSLRSLTSMGTYSSGTVSVATAKPVWPMPISVSKHTTIKPTSPPLTKSSRSLSLVSLSSLAAKSIKYGSGRHSDVELIPQPSDDPDDPLVGVLLTLALTDTRTYTLSVPVSVFVSLCEMQHRQHRPASQSAQGTDNSPHTQNWPRWRKDLNLAALLVSVGLVGAMKTSLVSCAAAVALRLDVSYSAVAALTAVPLALSAVGGLTNAVAAKLWGKRPLYLASALLLLAGCLWITLVGDDAGYAVCMGARLLQGLGWGAFDTLILGTIQDTYFEHERNLPVSLYNIFSVASTWGSPLIGGLASGPDGSLDAQFRIMAGFHALSLPLLVLAAPETTFDRSLAVVLTPMPPFLRTNDRCRSPSSPRPLRDDESPRPGPSPSTYAGFVELLRDTLFPPSLRTPPPTLPTVLQAPRALVAPTTCLLFALSAIPFGALWGLAISLSLFTAPPPLALDPASVGTLMAGPWLSATAVVGGFCFYRGLHQKFGRCLVSSAVAVGTFVVLVGLLSFGLGLYNFMGMSRRETSRGPVQQPQERQLPVFFTAQAAHRLSLPLLSFQLGILSAGIHVLDTVTRPLLVRSASFTSCNISVAHRSIGDMHAGVLVLRTLGAALFAAAIPAAVALPNGVKTVTISLAVIHVAVAVAVCALLWFFDETVWRADGRVMGLIDLRLLKQPISFFEHD